MTPTGHTKGWHNMISQKMSEPEFFKQTSDLPYDRHWYKIWCKDNSVKIVESYEEVQTAWWNFHQHISHIEVIDAKRKKGGKGRGFA